MRAATTSGLGRGNRLILADFPKPSIGPRDVLVKVHASSVNPKDWKLNTNFNALIPQSRGPLRPLILGDDLAGTIERTGKLVRDFAPGDAVYGMDMNIRTGAIAEYARIHQGFIAKMPENISFAEAAAVPLAGLTALQCLRIARVEAGAEVLVIGASGGVGVFAVQLAKAMGARVTGVCSGRNVEFVTDLGADAIIDYTKEDFLAGSGQFDAVIDAVSLHSLAACAGLMTDHATYVTTFGQGTAGLHLIRDQFRKDNRRARFVKVDTNTADLDCLRAYIESGAVRVIVDTVYPLENFAAAYEKSRSGRAVGKLVISLRD